MKKEQKYELGIGLGILGMAFIFFLAYSVIPNALVTMTKAAPSNKISINNSYVLADKILANADGKDQARVNVFILDSSGKGIPGKQVALTGMDGIVNASEITNGDGRVSFTMVSSKAGQYQLTAEVEGVALPQKITVTFKEE